jgi:uncharacterized membrane protein YphA (DoxX/SURF4 family)
MFYRVDYVLALALAGLLVGRIGGPWAARQPAPRLIRTYLWLYMSFIALSACGAASNLIVQAPLPQAIAALGDLSTVTLGTLIGLALTARARPDSSAAVRELLQSPRLLLMLCVGLALSFSTAALAKALAFSEMKQFFTESGYPEVFLRFVIWVEAFSALALLVRRTALPAVVALAIIMFGAITTHAHNADGIDDSAGAVSVLLRLGVIASLLAFQAPARSRPRWPLLIGGAVACAACAVIGCVAIRRFGV